MVFLFSHGQSIIYVLLLLALHASGGGPQILVVRAAPHFTDNSAHGLSINPREYYLGPYGTRCIHSLARVSASEDAARQLPCFSGRGVRVALLDTGVCEGIAESSRNSIACTSVVPGVACEDVGCAHGTRSISVLAGHLSVPPPPLARGGPEAPVWEDGFSPPHLIREYVGLAPHASVQMFRVFDREGRTRKSFITRALDILLREAEAGATDRRPMQWNTSHSPRPHLDNAVDVISLSYGGEDYKDSPQIQDQLHRLMHEHGVIVVAAAGNDSARFGSVRSPADMPGVLAVGALRLDNVCNLAQAKRWSRACGTDDLADVANWTSTDRARKYVAFCSGRGPTSWELPFGAGRIKPDLVALGHDVWAVQGVSAMAKRPAATVRRVSPVLQVRSVSGTSIAAPIVAGIAALCLEAARSSIHTPTSASAAPAGNASLDLYQRRLARIADSLQVREAILRTAAPLKSSTPSDSDTSPSTTPGEHRHRVLAGVPLVQLYARYLCLSRISLLAQGMGEVRPLRALRAIVAATRTSSIRDAPYSLRHCASFAIPPSVYLGFESRTCDNGGGSDSTHTPQSRRSGYDDGRGEVLEDGKSRDAPGTPPASHAAYWWPFSDHMVYPGAAPVLLNISLHLCPSFSPTAAGARGARLRSEPPYAHVTYVVTTVRGCVRTHKSRSSGDDCSLSLLPTDAPGRRTGGAVHSISLANLAAHNAFPTSFSQIEEFKKNETTGIGQGQREKETYRFVKRRSAPQRWLAGLLRVATELTVMTGGSGTHRSSGQRQPKKMPTTSFSLSVALSSPPSAETHLCYEPATRTVSVRSVATERSMMHGNNTHADRNSFDDSDDNGGCVPLFNAFRALHVEGALHIFTGDFPSPSSQPSLTVPLHVRLLQPPPRAQRVLIDTSLDWFNPTTPNSTLFIPGDDPHDSPTGGAGMAPRCGGMRHGYPRAYAEASGGDHPHTNLSLLWLYLRHTLGLAVEVFPLLHTSTMGTPMSTGGNATASPSAEVRSASNLLRSAQGSSAGVMAARVGTLIVIDPERPLTAEMRRLLTRAVLNDGADHPTDGLNVVLVTDWYSANVSARMRWTRGGSTKEKSCFSDEGDVVRSLRTRRRWPNGTVSGLAGTSHVPSWNRWLSELSVASGSRTGCSDCHGVTSQHNSDPFSATAALPFVLSDDIVMDGVLVVDAAAPERRGQSDDNAKRTHGSVTTAETVAVRSLGQLNAAGVLLWRYPVQTPLKQKQKTERHTAKVSATPSAHGSGGEAVMCNIMPRWAQQQRRLVKRFVVAEVENLTVTTRDTWESMPNIDWWKEMRRIKGLEAMEKGAEAPSANETQVQESLSYGVFGFLTPPPLSTRNTTNYPRPGRIAIFTDSDCLSTSDHHVQAVLGELEGLLYPPAVSPGAACATWGCFAHSPEGQKLLQAESTHSSTCVELLKEMLLWTHTGNLYRWQEASKLHCEARTWAREAHGCPLNSTPNEHRVKEDEAGPDSDDSGPSDTRFDDLLGTAPERAEVGEVVWRLWSSLGDVPARDTAQASPERLAGKRNVWGDDAAGQKHALDRMMDALMVKYHGDWRVHLEDCDVAHACTSAVGDSPVPPLPTSDDKWCDLASAPPPPQDLFSAESILPSSYMPDALRWLLHPIVLGQLMLGATASACLLFCRLVTSRGHAQDTSPH